MSSAPPDALKLLILDQHSFIGLHLAAAAHGTGIHVLGFSPHDETGPGNRILRSMHTPEIPTVSGDASDPGEILAVLERYRPDVVIGAVDRKPEVPAPPGWLAGCEINFQVAHATIEACALLPPDERPFLIWTGSQDEYGLAPGPWTEGTLPEPASPYAASKLSATDLIAGSIRAGIVSGCVTRLPVMFGEGQDQSMLVPLFVTAALQGLPLPVEAAESMFMLGYMPDAAEWLIRLASAHHAAAFPEVMNTPGYTPITIHEFVGLLDELLPGQVIAEPRLDDPLDQQSPWPDVTLAEKTGMGQILETPIDLALSQTIEWYKHNRWFWIPEP